MFIVDIHLMALMGGFLFNLDQGGQLGGGGGGNVVGGGVLLLLEA